MAKWLRKRITEESINEGKKIKISRELSILLANRGINDSISMNKFINPRLSDLYDGLLMKDMDKGTDIILDAMNKGLKIAVYGDYDADGVTSTTILYGSLRSLYDNITYHLPLREEEGYGLNKNRIKTLCNDGVQVILTCDNGISAFSEVEFASSLGLKVVITDHHEVPHETKEGKEIEVTPKACAVINPKQSSCNYPFKNLCGAGVALKFAQIIYKKKSIHFDFKKYLQFCAIGTVCDVVDLVDENRIIVKYGLEVLNCTDNIGLKALIKECSISDKKLTTYDLGFVIGPCINATGRLKTASTSLELFFSDTCEKAANLAKELRDLNCIRQDLTEQYTEGVLATLQDPIYKNHKVLLVYDKNIHESIAGIVAGRIKEKYNLPTFILTKAKEGVKGSGRSISEYNMFKELCKCEDLLDKFGGHPMAAGLSLKEENIPVLRSTLNNNCTLTDSDIEPKITVDKILTIKDISSELLTEIELLEPFGKGNASPIFGTLGLKVCKIALLGKDSDVLKITFIDSNIFIDAIAFKEGKNFVKFLEDRYGEVNSRNILMNPRELKLDIIYSIGLNTYNGKTSIQLYIKDYRISSNNK